MLYFSIVIPLYNKAFYIENTIKSVLFQSYSNYEIIIVNDGSTDESEVKVLGLNDSRIQLYNQKNQGVSVAIKFGIEKSKGKLVAFLDADDYWFPNHLEEIVKLYTKYPNRSKYRTLQVLGYFTVDFIKFKKKMRFPGSPKFLTFFR